MRVMTVVLQVLVSVVVTAVAMPAILVGVPAAREAPIGIGVVVALLAATFLLMRVVWPRPRA